jgi:biotin operon repressor
MSKFYQLLIKTNDYIMEILLRDPHVLPSNEVIAQALGKSYEAFDEMMKTITSDGYTLEPNWRFYNDGNAWLCKVSFKKKTVFWLSVWPGFFKTTFYFTEKTCQGIDSLNISEDIKKDFKSTKNVGKLLPMTIAMKEKEQIKDLLSIVEYKKSLK